MNSENKLIMYHPEELPLGEAHDPVEESEVGIKVREMSRVEAREYCRGLGIPWRQVISNGWRKRSE